MSSADGQDGLNNLTSRIDGFGHHETVETMLFESLVYQLIEKGVLTKNDALSIVQTAAEVKRSRLAGKAESPEIDADLSLLRRLYESFEAVRDRSAIATGDRSNVQQLRPPLHQDAPEFPNEES